MQSIEITQELLQRLFYYKDGNLYWKEKTSKYSKIDLDSPVGNINGHGYKVVCLYGYTWMVHRLVFLFHNGKIPDYIDHINCDRSDNRIENLRECTLQQNQMNTRKLKQGTSVYKGVSWCKYHKKWRSRLRLKGNKSIHAGYYNSEIEAAKAYNEAAKRYFGEFARLNEV